MSRRGWLLFAALGVIWGLPYLLIKICVAELPVAVLVFARVALGAAVLVPFAWRGFPAALLWQRRGPLLAFALLEFALPWGLLSHAEQSIDSAMAGLLMATIPAIAVVLGRLVGDQERMGLGRLAGLSVGFAGVAVLAVPAWTADRWAILEVLAAAAAYAAAAVVAGRRLQDIPALPMTATCLALAALAYLPAAANAWPAHWPSGGVLVAMGLLSVVCTALAFVWFFGLVREVGVSRAVVITYVNPAVAVAAGAAFLHEPVTVATAAAFVLILAGSFLATRGGAASAPFNPRRHHRSQAMTEISTPGDRVAERTGLPGAVALVIAHRTRPGQREDARRAWEAHMQAAIAANPGHLVYVYCQDDADPDVLCAFQLYASQEEAERFLHAPACADYLQAVTPFLAGPPRVTTLRPLWAKGA